MRCLLNISMVQPSTMQNGPRPRPSLAAQHREVQEPSSTDANPSCSVKSRGSSLPLCLCARSRAIRSAQSLPAALKMRWEARVQWDGGREGTGQTVGIHPQSKFFIPSIYRIFRASQNTKRWRVINKMFAKFQPLDARVIFFC